MGYSTAGSLINRSAVQLGLLNGPVSSLPDPFASTDPNIAQLIEYCNSLGDDLLRGHDWQHLVKDYTFTTLLGTLTYAMPADFHAMVDQTLWNRTTRLPGIGPVSGQQAAYLKARLPNLIINVVFRVEGTNLVTPVQPPVGATVAYEYESTYWVASGGTTGDKTAPTVTGDTILFDAELFVAGLKLLWLTDRGFDTAAAQKRYDDLLEHCIGVNAAAPELSLSGPPVLGQALDRGIDIANLPITGYGS